jgi:hypothetical protein
MSREEFEKINSMFLNPEQREAMNQYALQLKQTQLQFNLLKEKSLLKIMPLFVELSKWLTDISQLWGNVANNIINVIKANEGLQVSLKALAIILAGIFAWFHPIIGALTALYLIIEDIAGYFMGYKSVTGFVINHLLDFFEDLGEKIANSKIAQFFKEFKNGIESLTHITLPNWLEGLLSGNWAFALNFNKPQDKDYSMPTPKEVIPDITPSTDMSSHFINSTYNNDYKFDIHTNLSMDRVIKDLAPSIDFAQMNYAYGQR